MSEFVIRGAHALHGECTVQGSKNSALPILAASLLVDGETLLHNCPRIRDADCALEILRAFGCRADRQGRDIYIDSRVLSGFEIPEQLMRRMRSSILFAGAMLARTGLVRLSRPGGCCLGERPIDYHIEALRALGAEMDCDGVSYFCRAPKLHSARITLPFPSVGATENAILAACAAEGISVIEGAAREPEIADLAGFLNLAGFSVRGAGSSTVLVTGGKSRSHVEYTIRGDRIAAGTLLCAAAATGGALTLTGVDPKRLTALTCCLQAAGLVLCTREDGISIAARGRPAALVPVETGPYPGFSTDLQPPLLALMCLSRGESVFIENIFEARYNHIDGLLRMGAKIRLSDRVARVQGVPALHGACVEAGDLRAGAALITAALAAQGETRILDHGDIDRGYEAIEETLSALGADIARTKE